MSLKYRNKPQVVILLSLKNVLKMVSKFQTIYFGAYSLPLKVPLKFLESWTLFESLNDSKYLVLKFPRNLPKPGGYLQNSSCLLPLD
jgi:hypothetical protein